MTFYAQNTEHRKNYLPSEKTNNGVSIYTLFGIQCIARLYAAQKKNAA